MKRTKHHVTHQSELTKQYNLVTFGTETPGKKKKEEEEEDEEEEEIDTQTKVVISHSGFFFVFFVVICQFVHH